MAFSNASNFSMRDTTVNVVDGDQHNQTTNNYIRIVRIGRPGRAIAKREKKKRGNDSDQYHKILSGDIYKVEKMHSGDRWGIERNVDGVVESVQGSSTVYHVRLFGNEHQKFTAISYHGGHAKKFWKEDFAEYARPNDPVVFQLFGINRSKIPVLLFYDAWVPFGHFCRKELFWTTLYGQMLCKKTPYMIWHLWLNSQTGEVSFGPMGPYFPLIPTLPTSACEDLPRKTDMLEDDTFTRYLKELGLGSLDTDILFHASLHNVMLSVNDIFGIEHQACPDDTDHDHWIKNASYRINGLWQNNDPPYLVQPEQVLQFLDNLCLNTVYSGTQPNGLARMTVGTAWTTDCTGFLDRTIAAGGLTRFTFDPEIFKEANRSRSFVYGPPSLLVSSWLSQANSVFSGQDEVLGESCFMVGASLELRVSRELESGLAVSTPETPSAVYLFIRPPPERLSDLNSWTNDQIYFWSLDENGENRIQEVVCKRLRLPVLNLYTTKLNLRSWPKYVYDAVQAWQVTRGFDPTTTDFACSLGLPIFELVKDSRFEEIASETKEESSSSVSSWWSWSAVPDSDIPAFAM
ncbi:hypothetical protein Moror_16807 [Moniliophthora roreri MCA 2997]|uniref:Uncharacterized protein n=2 Tax=Moniliophthora roreri TaxID=221103 RepID=V2YDM0_MONRO|nr:hypothetical protein Moror_16807 [Moniliophthora roreri MCA 2997]KAI3619477.1 hypothetical protein WG66_012943 [Moniliophthora roreri]